MFACMCACLRLCLSIPGATLLVLRRPVVANAVQAASARSVSAVVLERDVARPAAARQRSVRIDPIEASNCWKI